jgi:hypothetical protein
MHAGFAVTDASHVSGQVSERLFLHIGMFRLQPKQKERMIDDAEINRRAAHDVHREVESVRPLGTKTHRRFLYS